MPIVTVEKLLTQCDLFKGKSVQLAGYLGECAGYNCYLAADEAHWNAFDNAFKGMAKHQSRAEQDKAWSRVTALWPVGVGSTEAFDQKAKAFQRSYVIISGAIAKDSCVGLGTDRAYGIKPTDIRAWTKSVGAPANSK